MRNYERCIGNMGRGMEGRERERERESWTERHFCRPPVRPLVPTIVEEACTSGSDGALSGATASRHDGSVH